MVVKTSGSVSKLCWDDDDDDDEEEEEGEDGSDIKEPEEEMPRDADISATEGIADCNETSPFISRGGDYSSAGVAAAAGRMPPDSAACVAVDVPDVDYLPPRLNA